MNHKFFGQLDYSEQLNWFSTGIEIGKRSIDLAIMANNKVEDFDHAESLIKHLDDQISEVYEYIERELYNTYRAEWSNFLFKTSRAGFRRKIKLIRVVVFLSGDLDMYFCDGGLFKGHDVVVRFSIEGGFRNCRLAG